MSNKMGQEYLFLFGAGADSLYGLPSSEDFSKELLLQNNLKEIEQLLGKGFKNYKLIHGNSKKVFAQTIIENKEKAINVFGMQIVEKMQKCYELDNFNETTINTSIKRWKKDLFAGNNTEATRFFLKNAVFYETLDEKFNNLRHEKLSVKAKRVISAYTSIFVIMIKALYGEIENWGFSKIIDLLVNHRVYKKVDKSYYKVLAKSEIQYTVATTNYTDIVKDETKKEVIYLHGNLRWFEDYLNLTVYDCANKDERKKIDKNKETIFPFLLIPSGVKPLICRKQLQEFSDFNTKLFGCNFFVVVGYRFNKEDNHINSIVADWLRQEDTKLIYFNYNNELNWQNIKWAKPLLVQDVLGEIKNNILTNKNKIINIIINENDSLIKFEKLVGILKKYNL